MSTQNGPPLLVRAGFPSPAEDYAEMVFNLNDYVRAGAPSVFFVRVRGESMTDIGINHGSLLVVDKALEPQDKDIVIAFSHGDFLVKRYRDKNGERYLTSENRKAQRVFISEKAGFEIWGVVTHNIYGFR